MCAASTKIDIERNASLAALNTLAIPATAAYCSSCSTIEQLRSCVDFARQHDLPLTVLGEGSNIVFTQDHTGLVVLNRLLGIELLREAQDEIKIKVGAGQNWHQLVAHCMDQAWFGLENLALIPGLVGASPIQNIGAYGVEVKNFITEVEFLEIDSGKLRTLSNHQCNFSYRDSIFKRELAGKTIITSVTFVLSKLPNCNLSYPALAQHVGESASPRQVFDAVCDIRASKLPNPREVPNAGSFFKNPVVSPARYRALTKEHPGLVGFEHNGRVKLAAAWLIEQRGWKQKELAGVKVHKQQALVITNPLRCDGDRVMALAKAIQSDIETHFSINLEIEPRLH